jgi:hypothetical protein
MNILCRLFLFRKFPFKRNFIRIDKTAFGHGNHMVTFSRHKVAKPDVKILFLDGRFSIARKHGSKIPFFIIRRGTVDKKKKFF